MTLTALILILNLVLLESLLSIDNVAVLAILVKNLPKEQQAKALRYGIIGAYVFRFAALFAVSWLIKIVWLKIAGGLYLLWLAYKGLTPEVDSIEEGQVPKWIGKLGLNQFWMTIIAVELVDFTFSIDNIFAAAAITSTFWIICAGVGIGILSMRFLAQWFIGLMEKYSNLTKAAYVVIFMLGIKLTVPAVLYYCGNTGLYDISTSEFFDMGFSIICIAVFIISILLSKKEDKLESKIKPENYE